MRLCFVVLDSCLYKQSEKERQKTETRMMKCLNVEEKNERARMMRVDQ